MSLRTLAAPPAAFFFGGGGEDGGDDGGEDGVGVRTVVGVVVFGVGVRTVVGVVGSIVGVRGSIVGVVVPGPPVKPTVGPRPVVTGSGAVFGGGGATGFFLP
jgi:hypothetical protein